MSVQILTHITCDGSRLGLSCDTYGETRALAIQPTRRELARLGWTRRHHGDVQIDLCPTCSGSSPVLAPHGAGRPPKEK